MSTNDPNQAGPAVQPCGGLRKFEPEPLRARIHTAVSPTLIARNPGQQQPPQFQQYPQQGGYAPVQPPTERPKTLQIAFILIMLAGVFKRRIKLAHQQHQSHW